MSSFGDSIKRARTNLCMTVHELAAHVNVTRTYMYKLELGLCNPPSKAKVREIAQVLMVDEDLLIETADESRDPRGITGRVALFDKIMNDRYAWSDVQW